MRRGVFDKTAKRDAPLPTSIIKIEEHGEQTIMGTAGKDDPTAGEATINEEDD